VARVVAAQPAAVAHHCWPFSARGRLAVRMPVLCSGHQPLECRKNVGSLNEC
jgi:hypothetical protein